MVFLLRKTYHVNAVVTRVERQQVVTDEVGLSVMPVDSESIAVLFYSFHIHDCYYFCVEVWCAVFSVAPSRI